MILATLGEGDAKAYYRVITPAYAGTPLSGLDGILFPSQARQGGINLVIFRSSTRQAGQLRVYDPGGALRKIALQEGSRGT